jgi:hypothetical protein
MGYYPSQGTPRLFYILKQTWWCLSVWKKIGQCLEDSSSHCPFPVELVTNRARRGKAGRPGQPLRGADEVPFLLKKSLGKTKGPASNQTKIQFLKKIIFIIEHIKKTKIFLKKKIETK